MIASIAAAVASLIIIGVFVGHRELAKRRQGN